MNLKPNDPCYCGTGKTYRDCHRTLDRTSSGRYLSEARKFYINRWVVNASAHERADDYGWMVDQIPGPVSRLLDIGVGEGSGLLAMLRRFQPTCAVALEENPECVRRARTKLQSAGHVVGVAERMSTVPVAKGSREYDLAFDASAIHAVDPVTILVTDPLFDGQLAADLAAAGQFDLVTVWLIGSHEAREHSRDLQALGHMTAARYRLLVQNAIYELADSLLAVGGRLQIVDRLQTQDLDAMRSELAKSHAEQAEPTTLEVSEIAFRDYRETGPAGVKMLLRDDGQGTPVASGSGLLLVSIVSVKR